MDSTHFQSRTQPDHSIKASSSKLPIKRKATDFTSSLLSTPFPDNPNPNPSCLSAKLESTTISLSDGFESDSKPPPFKFHRIWTEPDEIRFLQGLLDSAYKGLSFPRDLSIFYAQFSTAMSQPYTKSQLSEKLRRLRKKYRVISSRLARGLHLSLVSPHDQELFHLSKKLWSSEYSASSPFGNNSNNYTSASNCSSKSGVETDSVSVKVNFSPKQPLISNPAQNLNFSELDHGIDHETIVCDVNDNNRSMVKEVVHADYDFGGKRPGFFKHDGSLGRSRIGVLVAKTVLNVFDESLKEIQRVLKYPSSGSDFLNAGKKVEFERRWRDLQAAEFDLLARRLSKPFSLITFTATTSPSSPSTSSISAKA